MKEDRSYVSIPSIPTKYGKRIELTILELENIIKNAKDNGATNFSISEGNFSGDHSTFFFFIYKNDEEYNEELQEEINREQDIIDRKKSMLIS